MSNTVPADLPAAFRPEPKLAAVPTQPTSKTRETLAAEPVRTWWFIDNITGEKRQVTCLQGCIINHRLDKDAPVHPTDIWCATAASEAWLPLQVGRDFDEHRVLTVDIRQEPYSHRMHQRLPHATVEIVEDQFITGLDPDGLAHVIRTLEGQLTRMRAAHAQLVELRAQARVQL